MPDIVSRIAELRQKISSAQLSAARLEVSRENAQRAKDEALTMLNARFGVQTPAEMRAKLAQLQQDLDTKLAEVESILDRHKL